MKVLCVAEKPSISKAITGILSGGQYQTRNSASKYIKNYDFDYPQTRARFTVTAVIGHIMEHDFGQERKWNSCDPFELFEASIRSAVADDKLPISQNIEREARTAQQVMIWTDCDREGENIGSEIVDICRKVNRQIVVKRARFSAIIPQQIHHAAQHPVELDMAQAQAVYARIMLDLRIGAAFTRLQTLTLQGQVPQLKDSMISFGPCQFPTLGFVVDRYSVVKAWRPETSWYIFLSHNRPSSMDEGDEVEIVFLWDREFHCDRDRVIALYESTLQSSKAKVTKVTQKNTKKWKPLPLTTVELQKAGSRLLKISPKRVLEVAEKLYQQGFLSYPRTETNQFDPQFDFMTLIEKQTADGAWGAFATGLQNGGFNSPRRGKNNDKAHPPIHPTAHANNLAGDEKKVYDYISRRFLASCSKDALGMETEVRIIYGNEKFHTKGLIILERNFLEVFPYEKWSDKELPEYREGQEFVPSVCELRDRRSTRPALLTEADLVGLMDKNGIGTDATIAQHIQTILDRSYVIGRMQGATKYLVPSTLGIGLVEGYNQLGFERGLSKPHLRRQTERQMVQVCEGQKAQQDMITENVERYKEIYVKTRREFAKIVASVRDQLQGNEVDFPPDFLEDQDQGGGGEGGNDDDDNGGGGRGGGRGGRRGGRGSRGGGTGRGTGSRRARGGSTAPSSRWDDDDPGPPPAPAPRSVIPAKRPPASAPATTRQRPAPLPVHPESYCECGEPAAERSVTKESANKGRVFWACATRKCQYFQWKDQPQHPRPDSAAGSYNRSESGSVEPFFTPSASSSGGRTLEERPRCQCENVAALDCWAGPGQNNGRKHWRCANNPRTRCKFFEWIQDESEVEGVPLAENPFGRASAQKRSQPQRRNTTGAQAQESQDSGARGGECFQCGKPGHWAKDCPDRAGNAGPSRSHSFAGNSTNTGNALPVCYHCKEPGHYAPGCPNKSIAGAGMTTASVPVCYKCEEPGHYSNACPNGPKATTTNRATGLKRSNSGTSTASAPRGKRGRGRGRGRGGSSTTRGRRKKTVAPVMDDDFDEF